MFITYATDETNALNVPGTLFKLDSNCDATANIITDNSITHAYGGLSLSNAILKLNAHGCAKTGL